MPTFAPFFLARRNMRTRPGRTFLTLLGIILGVGVVLATRITNETTLASLRQVFDRTTGQASLVVVSQEEEQSIEEDLQAILQGSDGIEVVAPMLQQRTLLAGEVSSWQMAFSMTGVAAGNMLSVYGIDPEKDPQVRVYVLASGRMPAQGKYETVIPQKYADQENMGLGDQLEILAPDGQAKLKIVGTLADEGVALLNNGVVAFAPHDVVQDIFQRGDELDEISLKVSQAISDHPNRLEEFKLQLDRRLGKDVEVTYPASRGQLVSQMVSTYQLGLTFFSIIAIFVGAYLIYNAFSMTVVERTREIGMLRAIGMNRRHILGMVLAEAGLLAVIGSALGLGAGIILARGLIRLMGQVVTATSDSMSVPWQGLVQSLGVGILVTLLAAAIPGWQATHITPLEALRARLRSTKQPSHWLWLVGACMMGIALFAVYRIDWPDAWFLYIGNVVLVTFFLGATLTVILAVRSLERISRPLASLLYGNEGAIGSSNVRRAIGRTSLTAASLMIALTMIISVSSLSFSFKRDMSDWIDSALGGDLYVRSAILMRESFGRQLASIEGVEAVTPARTIIVRLAPGQMPSQEDLNDRFHFNAIDPLTYQEIAGMEFAANQGDPEANWQRLMQGKALFISNIVADRFDLHQGDELVLLTSRGEQAFMVAAVVIDFFGGGQVINGSYSDMKRWFSEQGADRFTLSVSPGYTVEGVSAQIKNRFEKTRHISIQTTQQFKQNILDIVDQSFRLFDVLSLIGVIIGGLGVINTLTMNVIERQREIGALRSLGMTRFQVLRMILAEAQTLGIIGGAYGMLIGYVMAHIMVFALNLMAGYDLAYRFTPTPFIISAVIALVVVQIAAIFPARRAAGVVIVEAIKHE